jgi:hypothetical protein
MNELGPQDTARPSQPEAPADFELEEAGLPDWMNELGPQGTESPSQPEAPADFQLEEAGLPDWMNELGPQGTENLSQPESPAEFQLEEAEMPGWMNELSPQGTESPSQPESPAEFQLEEAGLPDWMNELGPQGTESPSQPEAPADFQLEEAEMPSWMNELGPQGIESLSQPESPAEFQLEEAEMPGWMNELSPQGTESSVESESPAEFRLEEETGLPDWMVDPEYDFFAQSAPEQPAVAEAPIVPETSGSDDWLSGETWDAEVLTPASDMTPQEWSPGPEPEAVSPSENGILDWLQAETPAATEQPVSEADDAPEWMTNVESIVLPSESDLTHLFDEASEQESAYKSANTTGILQPDEMPDWMMPFLGEEVPADESSEEASALEEQPISLEFLGIVEEQPEAEVPEELTLDENMWELEPQQLESVVEEEEEAPGEMPNWLAQITQSSAAQLGEEEIPGEMDLFGSEEEPDWLSSLGTHVEEPVVETEVAQPINIAHTRDADLVEELDEEEDGPMDFSFDDTPPAWLRAKTEGGAADLDQPGTNVPDWLRDAFEDDKFSG